MSESKDGIFSCRGICWIIGALLGIAAFLILKASFLLALIISIVVLVASALILRMMFCTGEAAIAATPAPAPTPAAAVDTAAAEAEAAAKAEAQAEAKAAAEAAQAAAAQAEAAVAQAEAAAAQAEAEAEAAEATEDEAPAGDDAGGERAPELLSAAREGGADDLKKLKGVGPKLEQTLNEMGFYHFDQIADWGPSEIAWVDSRLTFKGRILRDGWVEQAKALVGGE